jgi:hypothetical protein
MYVKECFDGIPVENGAKAGIPENSLASNSLIVDETVGTNRVVYF